MSDVALKRIVHFAVRHKAYRSRFVNYSDIRLGMCFVNGVGKHYTNPLGQFSKKNPRGSDRVGTPPRGSVTFRTSPRRSDMITTPPRGSVKVRTPPRGSVTFRTPPRRSDMTTTPPRGSVTVRTPPRGSVRVRSTG